jgi:hypothetical protein
MTAKKAGLLLKLSPFGMTLTGDGQRPLLLMKDESGELTLPVPLNPVEAGVTLSQSNKAIPPMSPHKATELLLTSLNMKISRCIFLESVRGHLMVELDLENHPLRQKKLTLRAEEAMSLVLQLGVPIFATRDTILKSRNYVAEMQGQARACS